MPETSPNLHHMELFYHVVRCGGITAAARSMPYGIQQPAISGQISLLEAELGVRLFQRRPFKVTPPGQQLYDFLAPFFSKLPDVTARIAGRASSRLRLAAPAMASREHLPVVISQMRKKIPQLELSLIDTGKREVFELLEREEVDLAIAEIHSKPPPGVRQEILISLKLVLLLPPGIPMPKGGIPALAKSHPLVRPPSDTVMSHLFSKELVKRKVNWPSLIEVSTTDLVDSYVSRGLGIGVSVRVPGVKFSKGVKVVELEDFPRLNIAGLWRGPLHPLAAEVLAGLRKLAE
jgi:DNA-binding transcriptional LysR family regulator